MVNLKSYKIKLYIYIYKTKFLELINQILTQSNLEDFKTNALTPPIIKVTAFNPNKQSNQRKIFF